MRYTLLAQRTERLITDQEAGGSIPSQGAIPRQHQRTVQQLPKLTDAGSSPARGAEVSIALAARRNEQPPSKRMGPGSNPGGGAGLAVRVHDYSLPREGGS